MFTAKITKDWSKSFKFKKSYSKVKNEWEINLFKLKIITLLKR